MKKYMQIISALIILIILGVIIYLYINKDSYCKEYALNSYRYGMDSFEKDSEVTKQKVYQEEYELCKKTYLKIRLERAFNFKYDRSNSHMVSKLIHFTNENPGFSFDYREFYGKANSRIEGNSILYKIEPPELSPGQYPDMVTEMSIRWKEVSLETPGQWIDPKVNKNGIQYFLSKDTNSVNFRLPKQNTGLTFEFRGFSNGENGFKGEAMNTLINSFNETKVKNVSKPIINNHVNKHTPTQSIEVLVAL